MDVKHEALKICTKDDSQMSKLWKSKMQGENEPAKTVSSTKECKQKMEPMKNVANKKPEALDEVTKMMKDLQLSQLEAQKKLDEELALLRETYPIRPNKPYYSPRQYGNREYPPNPAMTGRTIRGCFWDGEDHRKEDCQDLKKAIERGDVHQRDRFIILGQKDVGDEILVPIPREVNGKMIWQKDWVREKLLAKESDLQSKAQCVTVETNTNDTNTNELMNVEEVIYKPFWEADVEEKRTRDIWDDGDRDDIKRKALSPEEKPKRILKRERPVKDLTKPVVEKTKPQHEKMWNQLRESIDISELSKRMLDTLVPGVTVRELLSISPDLIQQWFGVKCVPPIKNKEPDAQVNSIKKEAMRKLYACASPKYKGRIEEDEFEMLIDSGAELCLMSRNVFEELELPIDLTVDWSVGSANSQKTKAYGICHDVPVTVGGITARCRFFVLENLSQDIILGRPWE